MRLLRATQLHMDCLEIVSHYFAYIYEIRSHSIIIFINQLVPDAHYSECQENTFALQIQLLQVSIS